MEMTGIGGGVMLAIAAVLWLVYLVPSWFRRKEYLATERNAVRLQQTIRVLAETAETPDAVRRELEMRAELAARRALPRPVAVGVPVRKTPSDATTLAVRKRRTRLLATAMLLGSAVLLVAQIALMVTTGAVLGTWLVLLLAVAGGAVSIGALVRLAARPQQTHAPAKDRTIVREPRVAETQHEVRTSWTPVPVPKPLYLSRPTAPAPSVTPVADIAAELAREAAAAEAALRATAATVTPIVQAPAAPPSRFASMGVVDAAASDRVDVDALLARRRAAG